MLSFFLLRQRQPLDGKVVTFRTAGGEDYLLGTSPDKLSHPGTSRLYRIPDSITPVMQRGWITEAPIQEGQHCLANFGKQWGRRGVIQVYLSHIITSSIVSNLNIYLNLRLRESPTKSAISCTSSSW